MGSIPLAANNLRVPEQPNALEQYARIVQLQQQQKLMPGQLQQQQQTLQAGQLENQQRQQQLKNVQVAPDVLKEWYQGGKDINQLPQLVAKHGGTIDLANSLIKQQQDVENLTKDQRANQLATNDALMGHIDAMKGIDDPVKRAQTSQSQAQRIIQSGLDKNLDPQSQQLVQAVAAGQHVPTDDELNIFEKGLTVHSVAIKDAQTASETSKNTAQAGMDTANTAKIQAELNFYKKQGLAPGVPLDAQEAADWMQKNPGKGPAEFMKMKAGLSAQANATAQAGLLSDAAKQMAAQNYTQTGALPTGLRSPAMSAQVLNTAANGPGGIPNIAANKMNYKADSGSLASLQKNFDQVTAFENTAGKNLDVFLGQAQKVIDSGNPLINRPLRSITGSMGGTDQAAFDAARTTALTEISKVLNSSNAAGVLSDSARHEVEGLIKPNATLQQIVSAANILKTDMGNRHQAYQEQINAIKGRGNGAQPQAEAPKGMIQARDQQGKLHQAPAGTALPAGWKLEQ